MLKMGFAERWVSLVMKCVSTVSYSVNINGNRGKHFYPSRGLRQGDPLSPYLFLICSEGLSALIRQAVGAGSFQGVKASRRGPAISHLLFADDCVLFGEATKERAYFLKGVLKQYEKSSGQCVNLDKGEQEVSNVLGMRRSNNIEKYLGLPNVVGKRKKRSFQHLKDKVNQRIGQWSSRYLSQGGKEVFIKSVLQAIPTYAMTCFLLPKSLCGELESIFAKYWWLHGKDKRGIHWCHWDFLCRTKEKGGLGFRNMSKFNISLLAKQGWRIMTQADSLVARLRNSSSYTWKSIWAAQDVLRKGLVWRVGTGKTISINYDAWIPEATNFRLSSQVDLMRDYCVNLLIDSTTRKWKEELVKDTFVEVDAARILRIPLASNPHEDFLAWGGEASGEFSVRSAYKLLQNSEDNPRAYALQTSYRKLYRKLWLLNLPTKIKITVWKISWHFLPTRVNLQHRRLLADPRCPRCGERAETVDHLFRECPVTVEIWSILLFGNILVNDDRTFEQWLIWVCEQFSMQDFRIFCCALWAIWGDRNSRVHNKSVSTGTEIGSFIKTYLAEIDGLEDKRLGKTDHLQKWTHPPQESVKINFDGAFDSQNNISASGVVRSKIHSEVVSVFAAEAIACREVVQIGVNHSWPSVIIEGDSLTVIKKCKSREQNRSMISVYIQDIKMMASGSKKFVFQYVSRTMNTLAHESATNELRRRIGAYQGRSAHEQDEQQRLREAVREPD
ncbi:reverse transcriptase [Gossypium australe]|uniref:Reverse transcriptase n=1 Tax=Gossypium australe TaxID=47621 RepID=A0A5B6V4R2_9ROSI|nr:reverse transcriptase [Gossypium australe]